MPGLIKFLDESNVDEFSRIGGFGCRYPVADIFEDRSEAFHVGIRVRFHDLAQSLIRIG